MTDGHGGDMVGGRANPGAHRSGTPEGDSPDPQPGTSEGRAPGSQPGTSQEISPCGRIGGCCGTCKEEERAAAAARGAGPAPAPEKPAPSGRTSLPILSLSLLAVAILPTFLSACAPTPAAHAVDARQLEAALQELRGEMEERFRPGLHSPMLEVQHRRAALWFAGDAGNWGLADLPLTNLRYAPGL